MKKAARKQKKDRSTTRRWVSAQEKRTRGRHDWLPLSDFAQKVRLQRAYERLLRVYLPPWDDFIHQAAEKIKSRIIYGERVEP
jgi:hypothetical protein